MTAPKKPPSERSVRMYAAHLAFTVRGSKGAFELVEKYGSKRKVGTYRTTATLERGIMHHGELELRRMENPDKKEEAKLRERAKRLGRKLRRRGTEYHLDDVVAGSGFDLKAIACVLNGIERGHA